MFFVDVEVPDLKLLARIISMKNTGFPEDSAPVRKDYFNRRIEDPFFQLKAVTKILKRSTGFIILFYHF